MQFAGKFAFQGTNATGAQSFLTGCVTRSAGVIPSVSAPDQTATENLSVYAIDDGGYLVSLVAPGSSLDVYEVLWLVGLDAMLYLVTTADQSAAQALQIAGLDGAQSTWSILYDAAPVDLVYGVISPPQDPTSYLIYAVGSLGEGMFDTLSNVPVTPSYATIVADGAAPPDSDFTYTDLSGLDFTGIDLTGADFTGANLTGTGFDEATLTSANFQGATLAGADLSGATLTGASFTGSNLGAVSWGPTVSASGADFSGCVFGGPSAAPDLTGADLSAADLTGADLSGANLTSANLASAVLYGANLTGVDAGFANLTSARLGGSGGDAAVLSYATMPNVVVDEANLQGVDFSFATINDANTTFAGAATLQQANFANAYLEGVTFAGSNLQGAIFDGACLVMADFTEANLSAPEAGTSAASMVSACLQGANFDNAVLTQTNLANAVVASEPGSITVSYCDPGPTAPWPMRYGQATNLPATVLTPSTICPNGSTYNANQAMGVPLSAMLEAPGWPAKASWAPIACLAPPAS